MPNADIHVNHLKDDLKDSEEPDSPPQTNSLSKAATETWILHGLENEATSSSSLSYLSTLLLLHSPSNITRKDESSTSSSTIPFPSSSSLTHSRNLMHLGRGEETSSSSQRLLPPPTVFPLPLLLAANGDNIFKRSLISSRNHRISSGHAAEEAGPSYSYEQICSATAANGNVSSNDKSDVLRKLHQLFLAISSFPSWSGPAGPAGISQVQVHEKQKQCKSINFNSDSERNSSYSRTGQDSEKKSCKSKVNQDENDGHEYNVGVIRGDCTRNHNHISTLNPPTKTTRSIDQRENNLNLIETGCWSIGDLIRSYLLEKVVVHAACSATDQTVSIATTAVKNAYKSSSEINVKLSTERNSLKQQSSTPAAASFVQGATATGDVQETFASQENSKMKEEKQLEFILKSLVAGGVAGMCAKSTVAPLDRMKILLQAHSKHYSHLGVFSGLRGIVQKERFIALYKGNGAQMVRIFPYAATQFTSFEMYKKFLGEDSHVARFSAGSLAGVTAVALTYPLDTIRARLAFQVTGEHVYNGIYSCALHIFREEGGIRALYRGFIPTVCGMIPYAGLSFYCFESFKYLCMKYLPTYTCKSHSTNTGGLVLLLYAKLMCGGVAGAAAQTVAYPLDVTRRRMQLAMMDEKTKKFGLGMVSTIKLIYKENGVYRGLYRGMSINYLRAIPMVAVSFSTYELVKQTLKLDTGLPIKTG